MSTSQYILFVGLFVFIVATQTGRRMPNAQRLIIPLVIVGAFGFKYLKSLPSGGTAELLVLGGVSLGVLFGLTSLTLIRVQKDPDTGRLVTIAGLPYVALWTVALVARLGFAYGSTHWFRSDLVSFTRAHHIPPDTYATAFVLWVALMILIRTLGVVIRSRQVGATIDLSDLRHRRQHSLLGRLRG